MSKVDEATELATVAQQFAARALVTAQTQGIIFEALIGVLRDSGFMPQDAIARVFLGAAAVIDASDQSTAVSAETARSMRDLIARIARGSRVTLPPPGHTGIPRKQ